MLLAYLTKCLSYILLAHNRQALKKIFVSGIAAAFIISFLWAVSLLSGYQWIIGSFGATIFLLLVATESEFSQPKNLLGGHLLASLIGLALMEAIGPEIWVLSLGLCLTLVMMQILRVSHPPAASNPVIIFYADPDWSFILVPTALGACMLIAFGHFYQKILRRIM